MPESPISPAKICIVCHQDCSTRPRVRDKAGRYMCKGCADSKAPKPAAPDDDALIALEPMDLEPAAAPAGGSLRVCPGCSSSLPFGASVCVQCGFNVQTGRPLGTAVVAIEPPRVMAARKGRCPNCNYSLKGLKIPRCPECGTIVAPETDKERASRASAEIRRREYVKPVIMFAVAMIILGVIDTARGNPGFTVIRLAAVGLEMPIALVAYFLCGMMFIGFDAPMHLQAIRLTAVIAVVGVITAVVTILPLGIISWVIVFLCYAGLMSELLDLDLPDAVIVSLVVMVVKIGIFVTVVTWMMNR